MRRSSLKSRWLKIASSIFAILLVGPWIYIKLATPAASGVVVPPLPPDSYHDVYCEVRSYHSALIIKQPAGWRLGPEGAEDAEMVEYGWGNRSLYMESNYWPHALFAAVFLPGSSVVYLRARDSVGGPPDAVYHARLNAADFTRLVTLMEQAFARESSGARPPAFPTVEGYAGRFYPGREYYIFWQNCNDWAIRMLEESNNGGDPTGIIFAQQVRGGLDERWSELNQ